MDSWQWFIRHLFASGATQTKYVQPQCMPFENTTEVSLNNMIENWKDTAFGSDFGMDFLELIEKISDEEISIDLIYQNTDVKKYLDNPSLLEERTDNNVMFTNSKYEEYIHFEDLIIGLSAVIVESKLNEKVDLSSRKQLLSYFEQ